jgi:hypothetical protein
MSHTEKQTKMTLADHAEAWAEMTGADIPQRGTEAWREMYLRWHQFAFAELVKPNSVDVMFRVDRGRVSWGNLADVYALFPGLAGTNKIHTCLCYQHVGQHSSADLQGCINKSRPATPEEYDQLKRELERIGYVLNVVKRSTVKHLDQRRAMLAV